MEETLFTYESKEKKYKVGVHKCSFTEVPIFQVFVMRDLSFFDDNGACDWIMDGMINYMPMSSGKGDIYLNDALYPWAYDQLLKHGIVKAGSLGIGFYGQKSFPSVMLTQKVAK